MKKIFFNMLTVGVISLVSIMLLEGTLWLFHPLPFSPLACRYPYRNNVKGLKRLVVYERNMFGLRSLSLSQATSSDKGLHTIRILCIGASTTDLPTQNTEDLWSALLETRLQRELSASGSRIEVAAYGRGGDQVLDTQAWVQKNLALFSPDIVITLLGINDLCWAYWNPMKKQDAVFSADLPQWKKALRTVSQTYRHFDKIKESLAIRNAIKRGTAIRWAAGFLPNVREKYKQYPVVERVTRNPDPIQRFKEIVCNLFGYLNSHHIATIVLGQPVLWQKKMHKDEVESLWFLLATASGYIRASTEWLEKEMGQYNLVQKQCAEAKGCIYLPLDTRIPKTTEMFFDDCHFTDKGNQSVADAVYPVLLTEVKKIIARDTAAGHNQ